MVLLLWDASALAKRYSLEIGSESARRPRSSAVLFSGCQVDEERRLLKEYRQRVRERSEPQLCGSIRMVVEDQ